MKTIVKLVLVEEIIGKDYYQIYIYHVANGIKKVKKTSLLILEMKSWIKFRRVT